MDRSARLQLSPALRKMLLIFTLVMVGLGGKRVAESLGTPGVYQKDFLAGYLLAQALRTGIDPYQPLPALAQRFTPSTRMENLPHPTPHTLALGWVCLPFTWLPYEKAAWAWLLVEIICLTATVYLLLRNLDIAVTPRRWALGFVIGCAWTPVITDLWLGQFNIFLLVFWLLAWAALRQMREARAGIWLGAMIAFKLTGWPVVLWFAVQRRWRGVMTAGATALLLELLAVALHGRATVRDYFVKIGPQVGAYYRLDDANFSLWTFGVRCFAPFGANFVTTPPVTSPMLARWSSAALPLLALAAGLWRSRRERQDDVAFVLMVNVSLLLNPIAWPHYLLAMSMSIGLILCHLRQLDWPRIWVYRLVWLILPLSLPQTAWARLAIGLTGQGVSADGRPFVPFWSSWLTFAPALTVGGLTWLLLRLQEQPHAQPLSVQSPANMIPEQAPVT